MPFMLKINNRPTTYILTIPVDLGLLTCVIENTTNCQNFEKSFLYIYYNAVLVLSVINIFRTTFLSNHTSQSLQTWYDASARVPTRRFPNSGPPVIFFLFPGSVQFWTLHLWIAGLYLVSKNSLISCLIYETYASLSFLNFMDTTDTYTLFRQGWCMHSCMHII